MQAVFRQPVDVLGVAPSKLLAGASMHFATHTNACSGLLDLVAAFSHPCYHDHLIYYTVSGRSCDLRPYWCMEVETVLSNR